MTMNLATSLRYEDFALLFEMEGICLSVADD